MSIHVMAAVWKSSKQKANKLLMLLALADNANDDGWAYPSVQTLANKVRISKRNAQKILDSLEAEKEIVIWNCTVSKKTALHASNAYHLPAYGVAGAQVPTELRKYRMTMRSNVARDTTPPNKVMSPETLGNVARDTKVMSPETSESSFNHQVIEKHAASEIAAASVEPTVHTTTTVESPQPEIITPSEQKQALTISHSDKGSKRTNKKPPSVPRVSPKRKPNLGFNAIAECAFKIEPGTEVPETAEGHIVKLLKAATDAFEVVYKTKDPEKLANAIRIFYRDNYPSNGKLTPVQSAPAFGAQFLAFIQSYRKPKPQASIHAMPDLPPPIEDTPELRAQRKADLEAFQKRRLPKEKTA